MTKYVLNSGRVKRYPEKAKKFYGELVKGLGKTPKILICLFALPREYWEKKFEEELIEFPQYFDHSIKPSYTLAMPDAFADQLKNADVIYIHGGDDHLLLYWQKGVTRITLPFQYIDPVFSYLSHPELLANDGFRRINQRYLPTIAEVQKLLSAQ